MAEIDHGRFDYIISSKQVIGIIDYAHTPDALENVLITLKKLRKEKNIFMLAEAWQPELLKSS